MVSKDASMHNSSLKVKLFVLHYHDSEEASKKQVCVCVCVSECECDCERVCVGRRGCKKHFVSQYIWKMLH